MIKNHSSNKIHQLKTQPIQTKSHSHLNNNLQNVNKNHQKYDQNPIVKINQKSTSKNAVQLFHTTKNHVKSLKCLKSNNHSTNSRKGINNNKTFILNNCAEKDKKEHFKNINRELQPTENQCFINGNDSGSRSCVQMNIDINEKYIDQGISESMTIERKNNNIKSADKTFFLHKQNPQNNTINKGSKAITFEDTINQINPHNQEYFETDYSNWDFHPSCELTDSIKALDQIYSNEEKKTSNINMIDLNEKSQERDLYNDENESFSLHKGMSVLELAEIEDSPEEMSVPRENKDLHNSNINKSFQSSYQSCQVPLNDLSPLSKSQDFDKKIFKLYKIFKNTGKIPKDPKMRTSLVQYLQREKVNRIIDEKYDQAAKYQKLTRKLLKIIARRNNQYKFPEKMHTLQHQYKETDIKIKKVEEETKELIEEEKYKQNEHKNILKHHQDQEFEQFEAQWNDPKYLRRYGRPSSKLILLHKLEENMILTKMFDRAAIIYQELNKTSKYESQLSQERAIEEMKKQKNILIHKQKEEITRYKQYCDKNIKNIERKQHRKIESLLSRKHKIECEISNIKESERNSISHIPHIRNFQNQQNESIMTPRTANRYSTYKTIHSELKITIKPLGKLSKRMK